MAISVMTWVMAISATSSMSSEDAEVHLTMSVTDTSKSVTLQPVDR